MNTSRLAAFVVIAACAALALFVLVGLPDAGAWFSDRPEIIAAGILGLAIVVAADSRGPRP
jgi:hypothetical protein